MEKDNIKEKLIELIREYDKKCPECGKPFFGIGILGSTEEGSYPVYLEINPYPIWCGKCPECAQKCYDNYTEYIKKYRKDPCSEEPLDLDDYDKKKYKSIDDYIKDLKRELLYYSEVDCPIYLDENYQWSSGHIYESSSYENGMLIDLFDLLLKELTKWKEGK
ncbi:MAG: hypothetical protein ACTSRP_03790 [Candidatus Helarchaeota archaeon]